MNLKTGQNIEFWLRLAFICLFILGSAIFVPINSIAFVLPKLLVFSILALAIGIWILFRKDLSPLSACTVLLPGKVFLLLVAWVLFTAGWSIAPLLSLVGAPPRFDGTISYAVYFLLAIGAIFLVQSDSGKRLMIRSLLLSNAVVVFYGLLQLANIDPLQSAWQSEIFLGRIFSTLGHPNYLGLFILLTAPLVVFFLVNSSGPARQFAAALLFGNLLVLFGTAGRTVIASAVIVALFSLIFLRPHVARFKVRHIIIVGLIALSVLATGYSSLVGRFSHMIEQGRSTQARFLIWEGAIDMWSARRQGYGLETTGIISPRFMPAKLSSVESLTTEIDRAHSKPFDLMLTVGPVGLFLYYGFVLSILIAAWKKRKTKHRQLIIASCISIIGYQLALLVHFEIFLTSVVFWSVSGILLGVLWEEVGRVPVCLNACRRILVGSLTVLAGVSVLFSSQWVQAGWEVHKAELPAMEGDLAGLVRGYSRATAIFPYDRTMLINATEAGLQSLEHAMDQHTQETLSLFVDERLRFLDDLTGGHDGAVDLLRAWKKALEADREGVDFSIARAIERKPNNVITYRIASHCYRLLADFNKEKEMKGRLRSILPIEWDDPESEKGRIIRKEHPWLEDFLSS